MKQRSPIRYVRIYPLSIPLRKAFRHAAHVRHYADPLVVQVELSDGTLGYGETLPRPYVTGETVESVIETISQMMLEELLAFRPGCFADALEQINALPDRDESGVVVNAARAAVELALLDAYSRHYHKPLSEAVGWLGLAGFGPYGSIRQIRFSGVLSGDDRAKLKNSARKMWWFGLRDFKLKVGYEDDLERIRAVADYLGRSLKGSATLRLDANGGWTLQQAIEKLQEVQDLSISCIEQPLKPSNDEELAKLKEAVHCRIMHDESLVTFDDAQRLIQLGVADGFDIRISKNGGFLPSIRLAHMARKNYIIYQLGCMVGETSILSAAGLRFLENVPGIQFAEGSYGRFLLADDIVSHPVNFGWGGKPKSPAGLGWGVNVQPARLKQYLVGKEIELPL